MATVGAAKAGIVDKIDSLRAASGTTAKDMIYLAKALKENETHNNFTFIGAWANSTAYATDDVVTTGGKTYICILGYTSAASPGAFAVGSNWSLMAEKGTDGTDLAATLTTAGDVVYKGASALTRLAKGTAAQVLTMNSGATAPEWATAAGGGLQSQQVFTATGASTWTKPAGIKTIKVTVTGSGASGGSGTSNNNGGAGGGAGGTAIKIIDVSSISSVSVTIASGGSAVGGNNTDGNDGSTSSFGTHCSGLGGTRGGHADALNRGDGGSATGGNINIDGGDGDGGGGGASTDDTSGGDGGASFWGGGGQKPKINGNQAAAKNGQAYGSGGGGGNDSGGTKFNSGAGKSGVCVIEEYK